MPFHLSEEQEMIRRVVSEFRQKTVQPASREVDRDRRAPTEALDGLKELGLAGMLIGDEYGGAGADTVSYAVTIEELAKGCASTAALVGVTNALAALPLEQLGTEAQKERFLPDLASGNAFGSFALTEPNAGADVSGLDTRLVEEENGYRLHGQKAWILGAPLADVFLVAAQHEGEEEATLALVPADADAVQTGPPEDLIGLHGTQTAPVYFDGVPLTEDDILGEPGIGLDAIADPLRVSRLAIAACATGLMEAALEDSLNFADQREQFDQAIKEFQETQNRLARLRSGATNAHLVTMHAADARDRDQPFSALASQAKWYATETAKNETRSAIRLHGGTGFMRDSNVERYFRDARTLVIMGGPNQLHRQRIVEAEY